MAATASLFWLASSLGFGEFGLDRWHAHHDDFLTLIR